MEFSHNYLDFTYTSNTLYATNKTVYRWRNRSYHGTSGLNRMFAEMDDAEENPPRLDYPDVNVGDEVEVTFKGKVTSANKGTSEAAVMPRFSVQCNGDMRFGNVHWVDPSNAGTTIKIIKPAKPPVPEHWPPKSGQVWENTGISHLRVFIVRAEFSSSQDFKALSALGHDNFISMKENPSNWKFVGHMVDL